MKTPVEINAVTDESSSLDMLAIPIDRRQLVFGRRIGSLFARNDQHIALCHDNRLDALSRSPIVCSGDICCPPDLHSYNLELQCLSCSLNFYSLRVRLRIIDIVKQTNPSRAAYNLPRKFKLFCWETFHVRCIPVTFPPGRASLLAKPRAIGSARTGTTIGIVSVAFFAATA